MESNSGLSHARKVNCMENETDLPAAKSERKLKFPITGKSKLGDRYPYQRSVVMEYRHFSSMSESVILDYSV